MHMPKLVAVLLAGALGLAGCASREAVPDTVRTTMMLAPETAVPSSEAGEYEAYHFEAGLTLFMPAGMMVEDYTGFSAFAYSEECMFNAIREDFDLLGDNASEMPEAEYAAMVQEANGLAEPFQKDAYGNSHITYTRESGSNLFFYYTTVRKGSEAFWVITFACLESAKEDYLPEFELWSSSIELD